MDLLIMAGADLNAKDYDGRTALEIAGRKGCVESRK
jgi:ankyrin repeat protein